jgi:hypothetical protein
MRTMVDEIYDRTYQAGREEFHDGIERGLERLRCGVVTTFRALHAIQFAAPWNKRSTDIRCA